MLPMAHAETKCLLGNCYVSQSVCAFRTGSRADKLTASDLSWQMRKIATRGTYADPETPLVMRAIYSYVLAA